MFGKRITLFRLLGFEVRLDLSWLVLGLLITWSLADSLFPAQHPGWATSTYWLAGASGAVGLFFSILFHELSHSIVARAHGIEMKGITLFIFGGVAEMEEEPKDARAEFLMAAVGPIASGVLAVAFGAPAWWGRAGGWPEPVTALCAWLGVTNLMLAGFNLLPAFPLDGGRMLRAALWGWRGNVRQATRVASRIGVAFAWVLIGLGALQVVLHSFVSGLWLVLIGWFLRMAANAPYQQLVVKQALAGVPVAQLMRTDVVTVPRAISVQDLVDMFILRHHFKMFPVVDGDRVLGTVTVEQVKALAREEWQSQSVGAIAQPLSDENVIAPAAEANDALVRMSRTGQSRLMVVEGQRLVGVLSVRDLFGFLALKMELEEGR